LSDERIRNSIEGKFGQGKRRFSLNRVMTKLPNTSETAIAITFLVMNLSTHLSRILYAFLCQFLKTKLFLRFYIISSYIYASFDKQSLSFLHCLGT
jgi:IS5 family transposase